MFSFTHFCQQLYVCGTLCQPMWYHHSPLIILKTKLIHAHHTLYRGLCIIIITNLRNSSLVVDSASRSSAEQLFGPLGVKIVCDHRFLGGFLGGTVAGSSFILGKVHPLVGLGRQELVMCGYIPDSGCVFYTGEVTAVRMDLSLSGCCSLFAELEETLLLSFLSAMFGCKIFSLEQRLFSLTVRLEGLGLDLPTVSANSLYAASRHATDLLSVPSFLPLPLNPVYMMIWFLLPKDITGSNLILTTRCGFLRFVLNWILFTGVLLNVLGPIIYLHGCLSCPLKRTTMI